jgi:twitching motility protein PilT
VELETLVEYVKERGASDLIICGNHPPIVRINGELNRLRVDELSPEQVTNLASKLMSASQLERFKADMDLDFSVEVAGQRFRANAFISNQGYGLAMRTIAHHVPNLQELYAPSVIEQFTTLRKGLVIITGPTGSGKSTTMAAIIEHINSHYNKHILTIEDPIEYTFTSRMSMINQREVGHHTPSFASALKGALRENPDIIMLGELRDIETMQLALTAAETGHLVFCTLHTSSAAKTIDRIIDVFPSGDKPMIRTMLASSLEGVISQILLPTEDYSGRVAAYEVLLANPAVRNLIRENKIHQIPTMMQIGTRQGMVLMEQSVKNLFENGHISEQTAQEYIKQRKDHEENKEAKTTTNAISTLEDNEF